MLRYLTALVAAISVHLVLFAVQTAEAQNGFTRIAARTIDLSRGQAIISIPGRPRRFQSLRFLVRRGGITLRGVTVRFIDGSRQQIRRANTRLVAGGTFDIQTVRRAQPVRAITLAFDRRQGRVTITVFGRVGSARSPNAGPPMSPTQRDRLAWTRAQQRNSVSGYQEYVQRFPRGRFVGQARRQIAQLTDAERARRLRRAERSNRNARRLRDNRSRSTGREAPRRYGYRAPSASRPSTPGTSNAPPRAPTGQPRTLERGTNRDRPPAPRPPLTRRDTPPAASSSRSAPSRDDSVRARGQPAPQPGSGQPRASNQPSLRERSAGAPPPVGNASPGAVATGADKSAQPSDIANIACVGEGTCTPIRVFFGTNRRAEAKEPRLKFGWRNARKLQLGRAIVTVPRGADRRVGQIPIPTWFDLLVRRIPPEGDPSRHFVIVRNGMTVFSNESDFLTAVGAHMATAAFKDHAFVFVHGYRVSFDDALMRTAQLTYDLGTPNILQAASTAAPSDSPHKPFGTAFLYSWPSQGRFAGYPSDIENARRSVQHLEEFLKIVIEKSGAKKVHLIAHSMGNVPLLQALREYADKQRNTPGAAKVDQLVLAAPDMAPGEFVDLAGRIRPLTRGVTLYASSKDAAMKVSRNVHVEPRVGDVIDGLPTVVTGVDTIDISQITTCYFCWGHDEYVEQPVLLNDIATLLRTGVRPPHERSGTLRPTETSGNRFWRYLERARRSILPR
ncbi:MAG: alpha/beta hydrolase [Pseudomonadota bacterium]